MNALMSRLRLIPRPAWITGILLWAPIVAILALGPMQWEPEMKAWPLIAKAAILVFPPAFLLAYSLLVGFIYADAKRRRMRYVMWAWLALVPYFVGVILYFIMRTPLPTPCPECSTDVPSEFAYCPSCGASVHPTCSGCGKKLERTWTNCPHCGVRVAPVAG